MEDWQGCLTPQCQMALLNARDDVDRRGGTVITVEDFLLALLDCSSYARHFLQRSGVDMDELVRTIQCEQPIVTEVGGEGLLSSQLIYWLATARETLGTPAWLDWPQLLEVLAGQADRLQGKAYVAALEVISRWPGGGNSVGAGMDRELSDYEEQPSAPVVITDTSWTELAEEVAITLSATPDALMWVRGKRGTGKSSWRHSLLSSLAQPFVEVDLRRDTELMISDLDVLGTGGGLGQGESSKVEDEPQSPVLVLDNIAPADLLTLMDNPSSLASEQVLLWQGPIVLLGPEGPGNHEGCCLLEQRLGRALNTFQMCASSVKQLEAILVAHQAAIERRWNIQLPHSVVQFAASRNTRCVSTPGGMLQWVERASARLDLFARRGPAHSEALSGQVDTLRRRSLVAMARQEPPGEIEKAIEETSLLRAAAEVAWCERQAAGKLRQLTVEDLRLELERWVAAQRGPVHYVRHCDHRNGESAGAAGS